MNTGNEVLGKCQCSDPLCSAHLGRICCNHPAAVLYKVADIHRHPLYDIYICSECQADMLAHGVLVKQGEGTRYRDDVAWPPHIAYLPEELLYMQKDDQLIDKATGEVVFSIPKR